MPCICCRPHTHAQQELERNLFSRQPSDKLMISRGTGGVPQEGGSRYRALYISPVAADGNRLSTPSPAMCALQLHRDSSEQCQTPSHSVQHFRLDSQVVWRTDVPLASPKCPFNPTVKSCFPTCLTSFGLHFKLAGDTPVLHQWFTHGSFVFPRGGWNQRWGRRWHSWRRLG